MEHSPFLHLLGFYVPNFSLFLMKQLYIFYSSFWVIEYTGCLIMIRWIFRCYLLFLFFFFGARHFPLPLFLFWKNMHIMMCWMNISNSKIIPIIWLIFQPIFNPKKPPMKFSGEKSFQTPNCQQCFTIKWRWQMPGIKNDVTIIVFQNSSHLSWDTLY